jgi:hypothetical protein
VGQRVRKECAAKKVGHVVVPSRAGLRFSFHGDAFALGRGLSWRLASKRKRAASTWSGVPAGRPSKRPPCSSSRSRGSTWARSSRTCRPSGRHRSGRPPSSGSRCPRSVGTRSTSATAPPRTPGRRLLP